MASIWYIGNSDSRTITEDDWDGPTVTWSKYNGWRVDQATLSGGQITFLDGQDEFIATASDGPRPGSVVTPTPWGPVTQSDLIEAVSAVGLADLSDVNVANAAPGGVMTVSAVSPFAAKVGPRLTAARLAMDPGRRAFELNLTQRNNRKIVGCWIGASTAEGSNAYWDHQLTGLLEKMLQNSYNPIGINGGFTVKARNAGVWLTSGTTGETLDMDMNKLRTLTPGASLNANIPGKLTTGLRIYYLEGVGAGAFTVTIDGGAPYTITPNTALAANSPTGVWESPVLERGQHTYVITAVAACSIGNTVFRDGDRDRGVTLLNFARAGAGTTQFLPANNPTLWTRMASIKPDFVPIQLGHNDFSFISVAQFKTNLGLIVDAINAASPGKTVWVPCIAQQSTNAAYPAYAEALREFAATRPNTTFHSYREFMGTTQAEVDAAAEGMWDTDYTHMLDKGHELAAQLLADQLAIPSRRTWAVAPPAADNASWSWQADPGLLAFWDPSALTGAVGDAVPSLPVAAGSLSTAATMAQATAGKQPTIVTGPNSRKSLKFVAANSQELAVSGFAAQVTPATVLVVWRRSGSSGTRMFSGAGTDFLALQAVSGTPYLFRLDTKVSGSPTTPWVADQNWHVSVVVFNGATSKLFTDSRTGVDMVMGTTPAAWNSMSLGRNQTAAAFADAEISGLIAFNRALTSFEVGRLFDDWATRTGLIIGN